MSAELVKKIEELLVEAREVADASSCIFASVGVNSTVSGLAFGAAIEALKAGKKVSRLGWNGSGQFVYLVPGSAYPAQTGVAKAYFGEGALVPYRAYLALKTAHGDVATWAPSCSDALAEDWEIHQ